MAYSYVEPEVLFSVICEWRGACCGELTEVAEVHFVRLQLDSTIHTCEPPIQT